ncbi:ABC transporter ATP-binding protein [Microbacterium protaetiae]|uniref:ABC transporter ATP-binding protein n=1 Tax=Microbacterium protaetiae TaxID=2509458 RepID=A0A4P6EEV6_9MICO|nr:ABC transporter ATP-binding protein [Microbacterium protaetiae]QAY59923.1 ABC transporter ATP-binding protein [Microbacterium protaetiae]
MTSARDPLLTLEHITVRLDGTTDTALVDGVSLELERGSCLGLVGESGSGKSLLLRSIVGLIPRPLRLSGQLHWSRARDGLQQPLSPRAARGRDISMIFQEPMRSLNPMRRISWTLAEPLRMHAGLRGAALRERIISLLEDVGISDPHRIARSYPHELSGGLQQRVMIAAALSTDPALLLCDEPTTALDVTTQATILDLLRSLQSTRGLSLVFVSHDLAVVSEVADTVAVMYSGRIVEVGPTAAVIQDPQHSYTKMLVDSVPARLKPSHTDAHERTRA